MSVGDCLHAQFKMCKVENIPHFNLEALKGRMKDSGISSYSSPGVTSYSWITLQGLCPGTPL